MNKLVVGARNSPLSLAQVDEIKAELLENKVPIDFSLKTFITTGDVNQVISLRYLEKTNFFTMQIDEAVIDGSIDIAVHSAKDLPDPLPEGLMVYALTKGVDNKDTLVMPEGITLDTLKKNAVIGTSSERRENYLKTLREDFVFKDIRGTIEKRLKLLDNGKIDAIVIANAALIRLNLKKRNHIVLDAPVAKGQGQLAILGKKQRPELAALFEGIDTR